MMKMKIRDIYEEGAAKKIIDAIEAGGKAAEEAIGSEDKDSMIKSARDKIDEMWKTAVNKKDEANREYMASFFHSSF